MDSYINLYWMGSRLYDPSLGRWLSPDTTIVPEPGNPQSLNRYSYVLTRRRRREQTACDEGLRGINGLVGAAARVC